VEDVVSDGAFEPFGGVFRGQRVLVTGHTGFKGSWLTAWLLKMGAHVIGVARDVPTQPSMFVELGLQQRIHHHQLDIRDLQRLREVVRAERPQFLFHLAAQAIVSTSYQDPVDTISSNAIGTMNVLESLRAYDQPCTAVLITSDKCYDNVEWVWGYRETDALGGKDVYSGSKAAAEVIIRSYVQSFFKDPQGPVRIAVGRAGNVIGGGDWARTGSSSTACVPGAKASPLRSAVRVRRGRGNTSSNRSAAICGLRSCWPQAASCTARRSTSGRAPSRTTLSSSCSPILRAAGISSRALRIGSSTTSRFTRPACCI
jgi:nucleoside-diphosphate-sugar epimerase